VRAASLTGVEVTEQFKDHIRNNKSNKYNESGSEMRINQGNRQSNTALKYNINTLLECH
jgi:hypothetical protein